MARLVATAMLLGSLAAAPSRVQGEDCEDYVITAFSAEDYPGRMANGESTWAALAAGDWVAAGSNNLAIGTVVEVVGVGQYRLADRGYLGTRHLDLLMATTAEAIAWGVQVREVCRL